MHPRLTTLEHDVAEAAQAWLDDPRDAAVYARLVAAVEARRRALQPTDPDIEPDIEPHTEPDTGSNADAPTVVRPVGEQLAGDPQAVLRRLRGLA